MSDERHRPIAPLDLARYETPWIPGNPPFAIRAAWYVVNALFLQGARMLLDLDRYKDAYRRLPAEYAPGAADRLARALLATD